MESPGMAAAPGVACGTVAGDNAGPVPGTPASVTGWGLASSGGSISLGACSRPGRGRDRRGTGRWLPTGLAARAGEAGAVAGVAGAPSGVAAIAAPPRDRADAG